MGINSENQSPATPAESHDSAPLDSDLQTVIDAWPTLPETVRAAVLALITSPHELPEARTLRARFINSPS